jgi:hypothetical protein
VLRRATLIALAATFLAAGPARAETLSVVTNGDAVTTAPCTPVVTGLQQCATLRDAVEAANAIPGADQIVLGTSGTIQLTAPSAFSITEGVTISGPGAGELTVGGSGLSSRVFEISLGAEVTMAGFTISGGFASGAGGNVEVASPGSLTLLGVRVQGGQADVGGGIAVRGTLMAHNSLIDGNTAVNGAGLAVEASGTASLFNTTIADNEATEDVGGIYSTSNQSVDLLHVTVGRNDGAGMMIAGPGTVQASIVASNSGPACLQTTFSLVATSVAGDASCGFGVVADPGLSAGLVDTGGEYASYVPEVLTIPAGSPAEDLVAPCAYPYDQRFGERFTVAGAPCDAGAYERVPSSAGGQPPVVTPTPTPQPPAPTPVPTPTPTPTFDREVVVAPVRGTVLVCPPRSRRCDPLRAGDAIPLGSTIDTKKGEVELTSLSSRGGRPQTARFRDGIFRVTQSGAFTDLTLTEALAPCSKRARAAQSKKPKARKLWGDGKGKFRTKGRYAAATVRGTRWLTQDTCAGTLIRVTQGAVNVRDNVKRKTVIVRKGKRYTAKPRR